MRDASMSKKKLTKKRSKKKLSPHAQRYRDAMDEYEETLAGTDVLSEEEKALFKASELQLPKSYLSISQIEMYLSCPAKYEYMYVNKPDVKDKSIALAEGSAHHRVLEVVNQSYIDGKKPPGYPARVKLFKEFLDEEIKDVTDMGGETFESTVARAEPIFKSYMHGFEPNYTPETSELTFAVPVGDIPVVLAIDTTGRYGRSGTTVVDYKTVKRKKSESELLHSLQLNFYGYALWLKSQAEGQNTINFDDFEVGYCNLLKQKGKVEWQSVNVSKARISWTRRVIVSVASAISAGHFPLTSPTSWACDPRFCSAYGVCRGSCK